MTDSPKLSDKIAAKLDSSPKVREDWRDFFGFRSVQWTLIGVANAGALAVPAYLATEKLGISQSWPLWACVMVGICTAIGVFYGVLTKQTKPEPPHADTNDAGA